MTDAVGSLSALLVVWLALWGVVLVVLGGIWLASRSDREAASLGMFFTCGAGLLGAGVLEDGSFAFAVCCWLSLAGAMAAVNGAEGAKIVIMPILTVASFLGAFGVVSILASGILIGVFVLLA